MRAFATLNTTERNLIIVLAGICDDRPLRNYFAGRGRLDTGRRIEAALRKIGRSDLILSTDPRDPDLHQIGAKP